MAQKKWDTSKVEIYFNVEKLHGKSYSYVDLNIDGPDEAINNKIKQMQQKEFKETAEARLFNQKERYRYRILKGRRFRTKEEVKQFESSEKLPDTSIEEEFAGFGISDFMDLNYTDEKLADIIIDIKMNDVEEEITRQKRCCAWVLVHSK